MACLKLVHLCEPGVDTQLLWPDPSFVEDTQMLNSIEHVLSEWPGAFPAGTCCGVGGGMQVSLWLLSNLCSVTDRGDTVEA